MVTSEDVITASVNALRQRLRTGRLDPSQRRGIEIQIHRLRDPVEPYWASTREVGVELNFSSEDVEYLRQESVLLGINFGAGDYLYPRFQLMEGYPLPGLKAILSALAENNQDPNDWVQFFIVRSSQLHERPADYLRKGGNLALVFEAARKFRGSTFLI